MKHPPQESPLKPLLGPPLDSPPHQSPSRRGLAPWHRQVELLLEPPQALAHRRLKPVDLEKQVALEVVALEVQLALGLAWAGPAVEWSRRRQAQELRRWQAIFLQVLLL